MIVANGKVSHCPLLCSIVVACGLAYRQTGARAGPVSVFYLRRETGLS